MAALERRWAAEREKHEQQVQPWRFFAARGPRRSVTAVPGPLRYYSYAPPRWWVLVAAVVAVAGYLVYLGLADSASAGTDLGRLLAIVALLLFVSVTRITVSQHGTSFDIAGIRRVSCYGFIALSAVLDVATGPPSADWPRPRSASSWFPGASRVVLLYLRDGERAARSLWVRDPHRFATAVLGRDVGDGGTSRPGRRR